MLRRTPRKDKDGVCSLFMDKERIFRCEGSNYLLRQFSRWKHFLEREEDFKPLKPRKECFKVKAGHVQINWRDVIQSVPSGFGS